MVGAQSEESHSRLHLRTLYGMEDRGRIIHCPKGIYRHRKMFLGKALPDIVGKT